MFKEVINGDGDEKRGFDIREPPQSPGLPSFVSLPAAVGAPATSIPPAPVEESSAVPIVDVGKHVKLIPHFREAEVDSYFVAFERVGRSPLVAKRNVDSSFKVQINWKGSRGVCIPAY